MSELLKVIIIYCLHTFITFYKVGVLHCLFGLLASTLGIEIEMGLEEATGLNRLSGQVKRGMSVRGTTEGKYH